MSNIKETKEAVEFFVRLLNWVSYSLEDRKVDFFDVLALAPCISSVREALDGFKEIPKELASLSTEDKDALIALVREELDLERDDVEGMVEYTAQLVLELIRFYSWYSESKV